MAESKPRNIDEYIAVCTPERQPKLMELRQLILTAEPKLKEKISWSMPTFYTDYNVIHFAAQKNHIGIYPGAEAIEVFAERLRGYKTSKGSIQIPYDRPFDTELIADLIRFNLDNHKSYSG